MRAMTLLALLLCALPARPAAQAGAGPYATSFPAPPSEAAAAAAWVEAELASLGLEEKIAQMVMPYIPGGRPAVGSAAWRRGLAVVRHGAGGVIVGVGEAYGTAGWLNELQASSPVPLLVAADLEWGAGTRLGGATVLPVAMAVAAAGDRSYAYEAGRITAVEARAAGIHLALAPVADVNVNPANPVINTRSYGSSPALVADRVAAFIEGARAGGLLTAAKHFPGHGDTETDSHLAMPVLRLDRARLESVELAPFRAAIAAGVDGVMSAHLAVPAVDPALRPATLSPAVLDGLLRRELGFRGLVITDALHMDGVKAWGDPGAVAVEAVRAGADVLLMPPATGAAIRAVARAVRAGRIHEARIDASVRRILAAKADAGLHLRRAVPLHELLFRDDRGEHRAWGERVAERSLTLPRAEPGALPVELDGARVLTVLYDDGGRRVGGTLERELARRGARVRTVRLDADSPAEVVRRAEALARRADVVLFASFARALPWKGDLGLTRAVAAAADRLAGAGALVLSFGDPYLLRQVPLARTCLLAWSDDATAQTAAVRALAGEIPIGGRLPIALPPWHEVGDGVVLLHLPGITVPRRR